MFVRTPVPGTPMLRYIYSFGFGVVSDVDEAERWLLKAAEQDHPLAWNNLGTLFQDRDKERSRGCYRRAVELGFAAAAGLV